MRALTVIGGVVAAIILLLPAQGKAVAPGHEVCRHVRVHVVIKGEVMSHLWTCNTGAVTLANRLPTKAEVMDPTIRYYRGTVHATVGIDGHTVVLRYVWWSSVGTIQYANTKG